MMFTAAVTIVSLLCAQHPEPAAPAPDVSERAAIAAERAAIAAERAAGAAEAAAKSLERLAMPAPVAPPDAPKVAAPSAAIWTSTAGVGLISLTGNAQALTFTFNGAVERKGERTIWGAKVAAAYGQSRPASREQPSEVVALAAGAQLRGDYRATDAVSAYVKGGLETDHVKSVEARGFGEAGTGITWVEHKEDGLQKLSLRTDLAIRAGHESRFQYYPAPLDVPDATLVAPRIGVLFRYAHSKAILFTEDAEVLPNVLGDGRVILNSTSKIAAGLSESLSLGVSFVVSHDSLPAPGKVPTDTALTVGLELAI